MPKSVRARESVVQVCKGERASERDLSPLRNRLDSDSKCGRAHYELNSVSSQCNIDSR